MTALFAGHGLEGAAGERKPNTFIWRVCMCCYMCFQVCRQVIT